MLDSYNKQEKKRAFGCYFAGCMTPLLLFLLSLLFLFIVFLFMRTKYNSWEGEFLNNIDSSQYVTAEEIDSSVEELLKGKSEEFTDEDSRTTFIELSPKEVGYMVLSATKSGQEDSVITEVYIEPAEDLWRVYVSGDQGVFTPWYSLELSKDDLETAELYVRDVYIGPFSFNKWGLGFVPDKINDAYTDALTDVNSNNLADRKFNNIELLEDKLVIKGTINPQSE